MRPPNGARLPGVCRGGNVRTRASFRRSFPRAFGRCAALRAAVGNWRSSGVRSTGRPLHRSAPEDVDMQMRHGFAPVGAIVHDQTESTFETKGACHFGSLE